MSIIKIILASVLHQQTPNKIYEEKSQVESIIPSTVSAKFKRLLIINRANQDFSICLWKCGGPDSSWTRNVLIMKSLLRSFVKYLVAILN